MNKTSNNKKIFKPMWSCPDTAAGAMVESSVVEGTVVVVVAGVVEDDVTGFAGGFVAGGSVGWTTCWKIVVDVVVGVVVVLVVDVVVVVVVVIRGGRGGPKIFQKYFNQFQPKALPVFTSVKFPTSSNRSSNWPPSVQSQNQLLLSHQALSPSWASVPSNKSNK